MNNDIKKLEEAYDQILAEGASTDIMGIFMRIAKLYPTLKGPNGMADGMSGIIEHAGQVYEIQIRSKNTEKVGPDWDKPKFDVTERV